MTPTPARARADRIFAVYGQLPSYRAMLDREGAAGPADVAVVGNEEEVTAQIRRFADGGATEFSGAVYGTPDEVERSHALLGALARAAGELNVEAVPAGSDGGRAASAADGGVLELVELGMRRRRERGRRRSWSGRPRRRPRGGS